jgi:hypothetical protein
MNELASTTWWIHGSAPGGEAFFEAALGACLRTDIARMITCNAGLVEFLCHYSRNLCPDYYWLQDGKAIELYGRYAKVAAELGAKILTHRPVHIESLLGIAAEGVDLVNPYEMPLRYIPGRYQHVTLSGLLCLQWVANHALPGDTVILTGMTGYSSTPDQVTRDTFDGRMGKAGHLAHNTERIAPFTRSVCEQLTDVRFVFCGKPHRVFGPNPADVPANVEVCATPAVFEALFNTFQTPFEKGTHHAPDDTK